jgi:cytochrome c oxidase subunit II
MTWRELSIPASICSALAVGCARQQSILAPAGPAAERISDLSWLLFVGGTLILALVLFLMGAALFASPLRRWLASESCVIWGGLVFPTVTLTLLLIHTLRASADPPPHLAQPALVVQVIGEQWWWRVRYPATPDHAGFETANEIHLPLGVPVELELTSADVIHSFWVPRLAGKLDMIPGRTNRLRLLANVPGIYRGQCAEYCGGAHAFMALHVVVESPAELAEWSARQSEPAAEPSQELLTRGRATFLAGGCGACHTVRGTSAIGTLGPDLTHVGGRVALAAGLLPNHVGTLAGWIASSQHLKPDNRMPSFDLFTGVELRATASYLESLK